MGKKHLIFIFILVLILLCSCTNNCSDHSDYNYDLKCDKCSVIIESELVDLEKSLKNNFSIISQKMQSVNDKFFDIKYEIYTKESLSDENKEAHVNVYGEGFTKAANIFTLDVFNRCPEVLEKWQDRLNYIQVDEFQDSSLTEMELIDLLSAKHKNLMIVGDPDQNIYEWRGSDVKLLVDFDKLHIPTKTIFLNQNYRSTPQILRCANTLIENNVFRLKKDLFTKSASGTEVYHYHLKNEFAEAEKIVDLILEIKRKEKISFSDFFNCNSK